MKIYTIVVTTLLLILVIAGYGLGILKYLDLQTQISTNLSTEQYNSKVLEKQVVRNAKVQNKNSETIQAEIGILYKAVIQLSGLDQDDKPTSVDPRDTSKYESKNTK